MNKEIEEMAVIGCVRNPQAHTADEYAAIKEKAVKEFSEKLIKLVFDYLDVENAEQAEKLSIIDSTLTYDVILDAIDKLIEEEN